MQTFTLASGTIVAYLIKTIDEWTGDAGPNELNTPATFMVRTLDQTPPYFTSAYPRITKTFHTAARLAVEINEAATVTYLVVPRSLQLTPTADEVFDKSVRPRYQVTPAAAGELLVPLALQVTTGNVTGLRGLTEYNIWVIAEDAAGNRMAEPIAVPFETLDNQPPDLQAAVTNVGTDRVTVRVQLDEPGQVFYVALAQPASGVLTCPGGSAIREQAQAGSSTHAGSFSVSRASTDTSR